MKPPDFTIDHVMTDGDPPGIAVGLMSVFQKEVQCILQVEGADFFFPLTVYNGGYTGLNRVIAGLTGLFQIQRLCQPERNHKTESDLLPSVFYGCQGKLR